MPSSRGPSPPREDFLHLLESAGGVFTTEPLGNQRSPQKRDPPLGGPGVGKGRAALTSQGPRRAEEVSEHPHGVAHGQPRGPARVCCLLGSRAGEAHVSERPAHPPTRGPRAGRVPRASREAPGQAERPVPPGSRAGRAPRAPREATVGREPCAEDKQNSECAEKYFWEHFQMGFPVP